MLYMPDWTDSLCVCVCVRAYLEQDFAAVDAHGVHGAKGHEGDGDGRCRVHCVIVAKHRHRGQMEESE